MDKFCIYHEEEDVSGSNEGGKNVTLLFGQTEGKTALHFLKNRLSLRLPAAAQRHHGDRSEIGNMIG